MHRYTLIIKGNALTVSIVITPLLKSLCVCNEQSDWPFGTRMLVKVTQTFDSIKHGGGLESRGGSYDTI